MQAAGKTQYRAIMLSFWARPGYCGRTMAINTIGTDAASILAKALRNKISEGQPIRLQEKVCRRHDREKSHNCR